MNARHQLVGIVGPVHNEEPVLESNARLMLDYLRSEYPFRSSVVVDDNASTDGPAAIGSRLAALEPQVSFLRLEHKGRGLALRAAWLASEVDVVSYMDVDLSTNLTSFLPLVAPLLSGHSEVAIGTRLAHASHVRRRVKREVFSRGCNLLVHAGFRAGFSDAQCRGCSDGPARSSGCSCTARARGGSRPTPSPSGRSRPGTISGEPSLDLRRRALTGPGVRGRLPGPSVESC